MKQKILLSSVLFFMSLPALASIDPFQNPLPCGDKAKIILKEWGSQNDWREKHSPTIPTSWVTPTQQLGSWIYVQADRELIVLQKISSTTTLVAELKAPSCQATAILPKINGNPPQDFTGSFSDGDLERTLNEHESGFIYVWSPMMPLSIEGLKEFKKALKGTSHHLTVLLDPNASLKQLIPRFLSATLPSERRKVSSVELLFRDVQNHYPAIVFYNHKKINPVLKYGYEISSMYKKDIANYEKSR